MPPKTNQQRIKDLEGVTVSLERSINELLKGWREETTRRIDKLEKRMTARDDRIRELENRLAVYEGKTHDDERFIKMQEKIDDLLDAAEQDYYESTSIDERFENHREIIISLKDEFNEHVIEPGAHDAPWIARQARERRVSERAAAAAAIAAARAAEESSEEVVK
jgi:chromosome segregation ATPase